MDERTRHLVGRRIVSHVDNCAAKDAIIHGYSSNDTLNACVGKIHRTFSNMSSWIYFLYVNTKFNLSDTLTRFELESIINDFGVKKVEANVPL